VTGNSITRHAAKDPEQHKTAFKTSGNAAEQQERTQGILAPAHDKNSRKKPFI
jgi:hypothetical protein